ncbi:MAG: orotate phosphoribosyltransferase [Euryarchaeota archaeon]|nr:orotate phosphoribosyltransferase [Euryarchaeota archaeon]
MTVLQKHWVLYETLHNQVWTISAKVHGRPTTTNNGENMAESTTIDDARTRLIEKVRNLAYLCADTEEFTLASGRTSKHFFDTKPVMCDPESAHLLGVLIHDRIDNIEGGVDVVGGLELGAVPLTGIAIAKAGVGSSLRGFIMRKEPKGRGGRKTGNPPGIEGSTIQAGDRVVILEDVTTTGGSALKACARLQDMGCQVVACITIVDREEGGQDAFSAAGIPLIPLTTLADYA